MESLITKRYINIKHKNELETHQCINLMNKWNKIKINTVFFYCNMYQKCFPSSDSKHMHYM